MDDDNENNNEYKETFFDKLWIMAVIFIIFIIAGILVYYCLIFPIKNIIWFTSNKKISYNRVIIPHCGIISLLYLGIFSCMMIGLILYPESRPKTTDIVIASILFNVIVFAIALPGLLADIFFDIKENEVQPIKTQDIKITEFDASFFNLNSKEYQELHPWAKPFDLSALKKPRN